MEDEEDYLDSIGQDYTFFINLISYRIIHKLYVVDKEGWLGSSNPLKSELTG